MSSVFNFIWPPSFLFSVATYSVASLLIGYFLGPVEEAPSSSHHGAGPSHSHHRISPDESRKAEEILQRMMQEYTALLHSKRIQEAELKSTEILEFTAKCWGKNSMNYGLLMGIPVAQLYEQIEDYDKMEKCLLESFSILSEHGMDFIVETGIADKLAALYSNRNNHSEAAKYALITLEIKTGVFKSQPSKADYPKYCGYIISVGTILSNAGKFKYSENIYKEAIAFGIDLDPGSNHFYLLLESFSNHLHQQGKTIQAIGKLEEFCNAIIRNPNASLNVSKIYQRMGVLYFTIDKFNECLTEILKARERKNLNQNFQLLCELASVYWELGKVREAQEIQQEMKGTPLSMSQSTPLTRSRYLATIICGFQKNAQAPLVNYHLNLRINRELPLRKENEPVEEPVTISRRLESCFLVVKFDPTSPNGEQTQTTVQVTKAISHSFEIRSPPMAPPDIGKFYEVSIEIYDNEVSRKRIGSHHQLIVQTPPAPPFRLA